jgi:hypothetical protein
MAITVFQIRTDYADPEPAFLSEYGSGTALTMNADPDPSST